MPDPGLKDEINLLSVAAEKFRFNVDKLHALLCMGASAGVSIALIIWAIVALI